MPLNIDDSRVALAITPVLRLAFRPLFLLGTVFSVMALLWWIYLWTNPVNWSPHGGVIWWHGHEMLFGFAAAIVVGFLLTAVQAWTGVQGVRGKPLAVLVLAWLAGRCVMAFGATYDMPGFLIAAVDISFLLLAIIAMAYPVIKVRQWRNLMFVPVLSVLCLLNASGHWAVMQNDPALAVHSLHASILLLALLISILGGRVIPAFTVNATPCIRKSAKKWLEISSIVSILLLLFIAFAGFENVPHLLLLIVSSIAALSNGWRFSRWGYEHCKSVPLLWSLHLAYLFIPLGFLLLALYSLGVITNISAVLHAITIGAVGGMILAMISRVTLGHTGRQLNPPGLITVAYLMIFLAAILRVIVPAFLPEYAQWAIVSAGLLWVFAFGIYIYFYAPMLVTARVDGRPG